ncbi:hypothetical protein FIBSPDRAFT_896619 [Athelia psychrophila]|uniref:Uncharacterized protein n=1 Tax=Athelia psychrophila TaxID=1759441 RepID=A0A166D6A0_9AGAM|nr:hypothetical protein FIBSPDRAFT_896619 [Fibularhizoctonia sp. CBS 109695]
MTVLRGVLDEGGSELAGLLWWHSAVSMIPYAMKRVALTDMADIDSKEASEENWVTILVFALHFAIVLVGRRASEEIKTIAGALRELSYQTRRQYDTDPWTWRALHTSLWYDDKEATGDNSLQCPGWSETMWRPSSCVNALNIGCDIRLGNLTLDRQWDCSVEIGLDATRVVRAKHHVRFTSFVTHSGLKARETIQRTFEVWAYDPLLGVTLGAVPGTFDLLSYSVTPSSTNVAFSV